MAERGTGSGSCLGGSPDTLNDAGMRGPAVGAAPSSTAVSQSQGADGDDHDGNGIPHRTRSPVQPEVTRREAVACSAQDQVPAKCWRRQLLVIFAFVGVVMWSGALSVGMFGPLSIPCGRSTLRAGDKHLVAGECIESEDGSRYFGGLPLQKWKARLTIEEEGATYIGADGVQVPISHVLQKVRDVPEDGGAKGGWDGRRAELLCSAERFIRKSLPFLPNMPKNSATMHGDRLVLGSGVFCRSLRTPLPTTAKWLVDAVMHGRGGGSMTGFSDISGELQIVNGRGRVLWAVTGSHEDDDTAESSGGADKTGHGWKWWGGEEKKNNLPNRDGDSTNGVGATAMFYDIDAMVGME